MCHSCPKALRRVCFTQYGGTECCLRPSATKEADDYKTGVPSSLREAYSLQQNSGMSIIVQGCGTRSPIILECNQASILSLGAAEIDFT
jgi:hypothetical protein